MPVSSATVGQTTEPLIHEVDERWLMAYAASLGDHSHRYLDTMAVGGVVGHPLFPVCAEWDSIVELRTMMEQVSSITPDETRRGVHATHDLTIERLCRPGDVLSTTVEVTGVERRKPGAFLTMTIRTVDQDGGLVAKTNQGSMYLGVEVEGQDRPGPPELQLPPIAHDATPIAEIPVPIARGAAHTYTECARIWNPIHTDVLVADKAGLPDIILHGTATLAHGISQLVAHEAGGDPGRIRRLGGRFSGMVLMASTITVRIFEPEGETARFDVLTEEGKPAVSDGFAVILPPE